MNNLAHLTKDIAHDISDSETFRNMKNRVETLKSQQWARYFWPTVGVLSGALVVGYGIRALLKTDRGQSFYRSVTDKLSHLGSQGVDSADHLSESSKSPSPDGDATMSSAV